MTGVPIATLRSWERRYDFPRPARTGGGHRRYGPREVAQVRVFLASIVAGRLSAAAAAEVLRPVAAA